MENISESQEGTIRLVQGKNREITFTLVLFLAHTYVEIRFKDKHSLPYWMRVAREWAEMRGYSSAIIYASSDNISALIARYVGKVQEIQ